MHYEYYVNINACTTFSYLNCEEKNKLHNVDCLSGQKSNSNLGEFIS